MNSNDLGALRQRLISLLTAEVTQIQDFVSVLEQEREVLGATDVEPLFPLAERKGTLARQLQQISTARAALLAQAGLQHNRESIEQLLGGSDMPAWQSYVALATRARQLNEENGHIITERLQNNHQALAILMSTADQPMVYGPDGQSRPRPGSRLFGSV